MIFCKLNQMRNPTPSQGLSFQAVPLSPRESRRKDWEWDFHWTFTDKIILKKQPHKLLLVYKLEFYCYQHSPLVGSTKKQYVLVDMKKTRMSLELKYAQPLVQSLFDLRHNHASEAKCHRLLYYKSEESMHRRLKYAM